MIALTQSGCDRHAPFWDEWRDIPYRRYTVVDNKHVPGGTGLWVTSSRGPKGNSREPPSDVGNFNNERIPSSWRRRTNGDEVKKCEANFLIPIFSGFGLGQNNLIVQPFVKIVLRKMNSNQQLGPAAFFWQLENSIHSDCLEIWTRRYGSGRSILAMLFHQRGAP